MKVEVNYKKIQTQYKVAKYFKRKNNENGNIKNLRKELKRKNKNQ